MEKSLVKISKYLTKHLRHEPERLGLTLEAGGWVSIDDLLTACAKDQFAISRAELETVVAQSDKQRFGFDESGTKIRANQGHSTAVDLQLEPQTPPALLYHGTGSQNADAILRSGLLKMARHHVHLSADRTTAVKVGQHHGKAIVFHVDSAAMHKGGYIFYLSANGVWLTDHVPAKFLKLEASPP